MFELKKCLYFRQAPIVIRNLYLSKMRFSSDQELYNDFTPQVNRKAQRSNEKSKSQKDQLKNTAKRQTLLAKFLSLIDPELMEIMTQFQKNRRPVFQKQIKIFVPQKISLYEDILIISVFKENEQNIKKDNKMIKVICTDLQSRIRRKQCTIKERIQKKLCKLSLAEIRQHIKRGTDISFNSNKSVSSGSKISNNSEQKINDDQNAEKIETNKEIMEVQKVQIKENLDPIRLTEKTELMQVEKQDKIQRTEKLNKQTGKSQNLSHKDSANSQNMQFEEYFYQHKEIKGQKIFFKYTAETKKLITFDPEIIAQHLKALIQQRKRKSQNQQKIQKLKIELKKINRIVSNSNLANIRSEFNMLLQQAKIISDQISKLSGDNILQKENLSQLENLDQKFSLNVNFQKLPGLQENTSQKQTQKLNSYDKKKNDQFDNVQVSNFQENQRAQIKNLSFKLCDNKTYIEMFTSNPEALQPLLWSIEQDQILVTIQNQSQISKSKKLIQCLIRYKSIDWVIQRYTFLKLKLNEEVYQLLAKFNPLCIDMLRKYRESNQWETEEGEIDLNGTIINV